MEDDEENHRGRVKKTGKPKTMQRTK